MSFDGNPDVEDQVTEAAEARGDHHRKMRYKRILTIAVIALLAFFVFVIAVIFSISADPSSKKDLDVPVNETLDLS